MEVIFVKKLLVLSVVLLLVISTFAFGERQLPQSAKLEIQVRLLDMMNKLNVTSLQASQLAAALTNFKKEITPLEKQRIDALTKLRDALISQNNQSIIQARKALKGNALSYDEALGKLKDSVESIVTVKQAKLFEEMKKRIAMENPFFKFLESYNFGLVRTTHPPLPPQSPTGIKKLGKPEMMLLKPFAKEDIIDRIVNSEFFVLLVQTLQLKASYK